jgi:hypothetical protein
MQTNPQLRQLRKEGEMTHVLVTVSRGIIDQATFFDSATLAVRALADFVKGMNPQDDDAAVFGPKGLVANAKTLLDENDEFIQNGQVLKEITEDEEKPIYIIGNPEHHLGFMVASLDDPLGFENLARAVSELGQMRSEFGSHLKPYRVIPVQGPLVSQTDLERCNEEAGVEDFDFTRIKEYVTE